MTYRHDLIRAAIVNADLDKKGFAEKSGISMKVVNKVWDGDEGIYLTSLIRVCEFLHLSLPQVFTPKEEAAAV